MDGEEGEVRTHPKGYLLFVGRTRRMTQYSAGAECFLVGFVPAEWIPLRCLSLDAFAVLCVSRRGFVAKEQRGARS